MSAPAATAPSARTRYLLPHGELVADLDRVRVSLTLGSDARTQARAVLDQLRRDPAEDVCIPAAIEDDGDRLVLDYAIDPGSLSFAAALPRWRSSLAVYLPELIAMAISLDGCLHALEELEVPLAVAPLCLRFSPTRQDDRRGGFRLLAVPLVDAALHGWSRASSETWVWQCGDTLLGRRTARAGAYAIGAALYTAIVGEMFPVRSESERFRRALRGQIGTTGSIGAAVRAVVPRSFGEEAASLEALISGLLAPEPPPRWRDQLAQVGEQLHAYRTAVRWEYEDRVDIAREILERFAVTAPRRQVPWRVLARLRDGNGDGDGALSAALEAVGDGDDDAVRALVVRIRRVACEVATVGDAAANARRVWLALAFAEVDKLGAKLGDLDRARVAHVEARYLGRCDGAKARLEQRAADGWDNSVRCAILARLHAGTAEWLRVAKLCKDTRVAIQAMPMTGGGPGVYLVAYLDYLDGVAHFGAVGLYSDPCYLADAFERFVATLEGARGICAPDDPLVSAAIDWLLWIGVLARQLQLASSRAVALGVDAYLAAHGISRRDTGTAVPPLIWYDEDRLLALSEAS